MYLIKFGHVICKCKCYLSCHGQCYRSCHGQWKMANERAWRFANVREPFTSFDAIVRCRRDHLLPGRFGMDYVWMTCPVQIWHPVQIWRDSVSFLRGKLYRPTSSVVLRHWAVFKGMNGRCHAKFVPAAKFVPGMSTVVRCQANNGSRITDRK